MKTIILLSIFTTLASFCLAGAPNSYKRRWIFPINSTKVIPVIKNPEQRITNGERAEYKQFPYQVGLKVNLANSESWCGGTLLANRWIITAAHCLDVATSVVAYLGANDIEDINEKGQQRIFISKKYFTVHEGWDRKLLQNDIALIKIPFAIRMNDYIQPVNLPKFDENLDYTGKMAVASGWGMESDYAFEQSRYLRFIEVPIMGLEQCEKDLPKILTDSMICIDTTGRKSVCGGDSGGPLVYRDEGVNYLIGTTSFGSVYGCELEYPTVFTRITSYLNWIKTHTGLTNM